LLAFSEGARVQARTPYRMPPHQPAWIPGRAARGVRALIAGGAFSGPKGQPSPQPGPSALESTGVRKGKAWKAGRSVPAQRSSGNELLARWAARSSGRRYQGRWPWLEERIALRADVPMPLASASEKSRQGRPKIAHPFKGGAEVTATAQSRQGRKKSSPRESTSSRPQRGDPRREPASRTHRSLWNLRGLVWGHPTRSPRLDKCSFRYLSTGQSLRRAKGILPLASPDQGYPWTR